LYVAVARESGGGMSWIPFVVRNDSRTADVVVKTSELSWFASNSYGSRGVPFGGKSLNGTSGDFVPGERAFAVTLDRPLITRELNEESYWLNSEAPLIRFLEKQGINYKMVASVDIDSNLSTVGPAKVLVSSGYDAYWTQGMRDNVESFRDASGHLIFMTAGASLWRSRLTPDRRTMWCYKDTFNNGIPMDPVTWTGTWKDTRWGAREPEYLLTGTDHRMSGPQDRNALVVAAVSGSSPFWRGTPVEVGTNLALPEVIGHVADSALYTAAFAVQVAGTVLNVSGSYIDNNGQYYSNAGNLNWGIVLQRYDSGAVVAGFGTAQWQWTLDADHDGGTTPPVLAAQQATINLFRDMDVIAATPGVGLTVPVPVLWAEYGLTEGGPVPIAPGNYEVMISDGSQWYPASGGGGGGAGEGADVEGPLIIPFPSALATWVIEVGYIPNIIVIDSAGSVVEPGSIEYTGTTVTLGFSAPFSGTAYCFA
jgi:hypothetical protein